MPLVYNMLPSVLAALAGFLIARRRRVDLQTVGSLLIYCISPTVMLGGVLRVDASVATLAMPVFAFALGSANSFLAYGWARCLEQGEERRFVASASSSANTLYFGLGLALAILPSSVMPLFLISCVGFSLSEAVWGYYFLARGAFSPKAAMARVARLPVIWALAAGIAARLSGLDAAALGPLFDHAKGALVILGSMILGLALGQESRVRLDAPFLCALLFGRHVTFAALVLAAIGVDAAWLHLLDHGHYLVLALFTSLPIANNTLTFASTLGIPTGPISGAILASNAVALLLAPLLLVLT